MGSGLDIQLSALREALSAYWSSHQILFQSFETAAANSVFVATSFGTLDRLGNRRRTDSAIAFRQLRRRNGGLAGRN